MKSIAITLFVAASSAISFRPPPGSNPWHKDAKDYEVNKPEFEMDYFVPNFGPDPDIQTTQSNMKAAEEKLKKNWKVEKLPEEPPKDYFVPNLGPDQEIKDIQQSIQDAEKALGHQWVPKQDADGIFIVPEAAAAESYSYDSANAANVVMNRYN